MWLHARTEALLRGPRAICRSHPRDVPGGPGARSWRKRRRLGVAVLACASLDRRARVCAAAGLFRLRAYAR